MNRNKYRGKSIDEELKTGEWIYGSLVFDEMGNPFIVGPVVEACEEYINFEYWLPVDPATVGQYACLTLEDMDIYEGDVLRLVGEEPFDNGPLNMDYDWTFTGLVSFYSGSFEVVDKDKCGMSIYELRCADIDEIELLGNVHDNPGLLEVQ